MPGDNPNRPKPVPLRERRKNPDTPVLGGSRTTDPKRAVTIHRGDFPWHRLGYITLGVGILIALTLAGASFGRVEQTALDARQAVKDARVVVDTVEDVATENTVRNDRQDATLCLLLRGMRGARADLPAKVREDIDAALAVQTNGKDVCP